MKNPPLIIVQLIHIQGPLPLEGKEQEFSEPVILIGRHPSCHLRFPADLTPISRKHAEIIREGNQFKLIDHSTNGTFVNGKGIKEAYLKDGDILEFSKGGPKISFLTQMKEVEAGKEIPLLKLPPEVAKEIPPKPPIVETPSQPPPPFVEKPPFVPPVREEPPGISVQAVKVPLIIQYGPTIRQFKQLPVTIGKGPRCEYILDHPAILEQHAQIFFSQNQYWVKDLTGQKSVHLNRQPIAFQAPLKLNDDLALSPRGPIFRFLGEGRLAEVPEPPSEKPIEPSDKKGKAQREIAEGKESKGLFSKFKKIFGS
jgi:pSer/pThr/pTyr-binding forkhead associated (FHA) protein